MKFDPGFGVLELITLDWFGETLYRRWSSPEIADWPYVSLSRSRVRPMDFLLPIVLLSMYCLFFSRRACFS